ncbi:hypothetical protein KBX73_14860 [Acetobacter persici]|uniref:hypothetical protein n=1 Tax=Acetobacter persici TaxID=1076596 RepID=UPI0020CCE725|nr:hypothetical protein [Acetobacter persici]MCP9321024.1 hypothetical protein [Acetobacter persici]
MTVYSFACSTPDNWSNWHFLAKTFGPGLIAGTIALMAYRVASTQKQIATNKYNLDMFDKRWSVFENYHDIIDNISKCEHGDHISVQGLENLGNNLEKCIIKSEKVFESLYDNHVIAEYAIFLEEAKIITKSINELRDKSLKLEREKTLYNANKDKNIMYELDSQISKLQDQIKDKNALCIKLFPKIGDVLLDLYEKMDNELTVPHKPYETLLDKIIKFIKYKNIR